ncbi:MAG: hypothetical protein WAL95_02645 [Candidatus Acidiferrales bacterium]
MNSSTAALSPKDSSDFMVIVRAGLTCGVMDITAAMVVYGLVYGVRPIQLLQGIASGLLGQQAYRGGIATALAGLWLHFIIAFSVAAAYFVQSQKIRFLLQHAEFSGVLYGVAVYFVMQQIVALSATQKHPFSVKLMLIGVVIHIFCVGLPIALVVRKYSVTR